MILEPFEINYFVGIEEKMEEELVQASNVAINDELKSLFYSFICSREKKSKKHQRMNGLTWTKPKYNEANRKQ